MALTWLFREITGFLFVFSGFVKAVDVWGTVYKFNEYLNVLGLPVYQNLTLTGVFLLCGVEFLIGVFLMFGCYRKSATVVAGLFMCVMLPLTLWIAISDPVADCGCFGDALLISNWTTFWKNVVISAMVIWLIIYNRTIPCIITPAFQWIVFLASAVFIVGIGSYGYMIQPMIDFRPYPVGSRIISDEDDAEGPQFIFTYSKDGMTREFDADHLPSEEDGWQYVSRRELASESPAGKTDSHDFRVYDKNGTEDVTEDVFDEDGKRFLLLIPSLKDISTATTYKINMLYDWAEAHDIDMDAIIAAHSGNMAEWEDLSMPRYGLYTAEDTSIKELARGNPAVVYLENGVVKWKSALGALDEDLFAEPDTKTPVFSMVHDGHRAMRNFIWIYVIVLVMLIAVSFIPRLAKLFQPLASTHLNLRRRALKESKEKNLSHDDTARHEE